MAEEVAFIGKIIPELLKGLAVTCRLSGGALLLGLGLGLVTAVLRVYGTGLLKAVAVIYSEVIRGTPLLVQLFILYYGLPDVGINLDRLTAGYLALGINSGAYQAEYFRAAIQSVQAGQMSAARALGLSKLQAVIYVILPQALRLVLPTWANEVIYMVKYASVVYTIAVPELLARGQMLNSKYFKPAAIFFTVSVIYIIVITLITKLTDGLEKRLAIPGLAVESGRD